MSGDNKVFVYLYDISQGMARSMSMAIIGKQLEGIWHTGLVAYGYEYYYGGGIQASKPGQTLAGRPTQIIEIGTTNVPQSVFHDWLRSVSSRFTPQTYSLLKWNCNNFTQEACQFITGKDIPAFITGLPEDALSTPMGMMLRPMLENMERNMKSQAGQANPGFVPWSENGNQLFLPPCNDVKQNDAKRERSYSSRGPSKGMENVTTTGHAHLSLPLSVISKSMIPLTTQNDASSLTHMVSLIRVNNRKVAKIDAKLKLSVSEIKELKSISKSISHPDIKCTEAQLLLLEKVVTSWPHAFVMPVLALLRLLVLQPEAQHFLETREDSFFSAVCSPVLHQDYKMVVASQMCSLSVLVNLFTSSKIGNRLTKHDTVLRSAAIALESSHDQIRSMGASLMYNCTLLLPKDESDILMEWCALLCQVLGGETFPEACRRELLALGTLVLCNSGLAMLLDAYEFQPSLVSNNMQRHKPEHKSTVQQIELLTNDLMVIMLSEEEGMESDDEVDEEQAHLAAEI